MIRKKGLLLNIYFLNNEYGQFISEFFSQIIFMSFFKTQSNLNKLTSLIICIFIDSHINLNSLYYQPHHEGYTTLCTLFDLPIPLLCTALSPTLFKFYFDFSRSRSVFSLSIDLYFYRESFTYLFEL